MQAKEASRLSVWLGRLLCLVGAHDFRLVETIGGFGPAGQVEKVECRRCGAVTTRRARADV